MTRYYPPRDSGGGSTPAPEATPTTLGTVFGKTFPADSMSLDNSSSSFGNSATTHGSWSTAIGASATAGSTSIAIGVLADAGNDATLSVGRTSIGASSVSKDFAVAVGSQADAEGYSVAIGSNAHSQEGSIAIGSGSAATGSPAIAIGGATVDGQNCIGIGSGIHSGELGSGNRQIVIGSNSRFQSDDNIFIGDNIGGDYSIMESVVIGNIPYSSQSPNISQHSVFIGYDSGDTDVGGSYDVAVGWKARTQCSYLYSTSTLEEGQVAVGKKAASGGDGAISVGNYSTAYGHQSTAIGNYATVGAAARDSYGDYWYGSTPNNNSTAVGANAIAFGDDSTVIGNNATAGQVTRYPDWGNAYFQSANNSTAVGSNAIAESGSSIAVGAYSGAYASNSTAVGNGATSVGTNSTVVGYGATTWDSNTVVLGDNNITSLQCNVQTISALSDARDKTNVQPLNVGLDFINQLNPVTFDWERRDGTMEGKSDFGFIAQELAAAEDSIDMADTLGLTNRNDPEKLLASYGKLVPILVQAVKDLSNEVNELKEKLK